MPPSSLQKRLVQLVWLFFFKMNLFKLDTQIPSAEKQGSLSGESCVKNKETTVLYAALQAHVWRVRPTEGTCTLLTAIAAAPEGVYLEILRSPRYLFSQPRSMCQNFCFVSFCFLKFHLVFSFLVESCPAAEPAHLSWQRLQVLICILVCRCQGCSAAQME